MPEVSQPTPDFAVQAEVQYEPAGTVADQYVPVAGDAGEGLLPCHASRPLDDPGEDIERVLVVVHGALRDADRYFAVASAAAEGDRSTLIVAPQFLAHVDRGVRKAAPAATLFWDVEGWKGGEPALGPAPVSSFTAMDFLLRQLTVPGWLAGGPKPAVVIIGNSAGGQYVNRYAAVGNAPDTLAERGIPVRFVISNPSTYLYFDHERPVAVPDGIGINRWRYGFDDPPPYVDGTPRQSLRRYVARDVTIVLGSQDRDGASLLLEVSAAAMAQGANRLERGISYGRYVLELARRAGLETSHQVIELDGVGHSASEVFSATQVRSLLFG